MELKKEERLSLQKKGAKMEAGSSIRPKRNFPAFGEDGGRRKRKIRFKEYREKGQSW